MSVLTEEDYFYGNLKHIEQIKKNVNLPVLWKDFFIDSFQIFKDRGIDEIYCVVVNDIYVAKSWSDFTGSGKAGINIITDPLSILAEELDAEFSVKGTGLLRRLQRFTMIINDRKIEKLYFEKERGVCDATSAKSILNDLN